MLYLVVFGSIIALNCYLWLLTRVPAQKVTTYALVNPVVALILGAVVLDERITLLAVAAAVLVLVGVALVLFQDVSPLKLMSGAPHARECSEANSVSAEWATGAMHARRLHAEAARRVRRRECCATSTMACSILTFDPAYRDEFRRLNVAWLTRYFQVEPIDERVLGDPEGEILAPGGEILFAR